MNALFWLQKNNLIYCDIVINYDILENIPDKFIFKKILLKIVNINQDNEKHKKY